LNKKDIAEIRRQFKLNNELMQIKEIFNVYVVKDSNDIYHYQHMPFELLEDEQKELFIHNFKKVLTGQLDRKLFELKFKQDAEDSTQFILHQGLLGQQTEEWTKQMLRIVEKMLKDRTYEMDIVVTFIRAEYMKPMKRVSEASEESERDTVYSHPFILCSINKTMDPKKELLFDYAEKEFKYNIVVDPIINLKAPISGFLFPAMTDQGQDVNRLLYSAGKANEPDFYFTEEVLNAEEIITADEDKIAFEEIVRNVTGDQISTRTLSSVYEEINHIVEEHEDAEEEMAKLDYRDVEQVLTNSGIKDVDRERVESAFETVIDDSTYEIKANNVLPKFTSKSIKIETKAANISVSPQDLRYLRQVELDGKLYLMIELEENTVIEGFEVAPEELFEKVEEQDEVDS